MNINPIIKKLLEKRGITEPADMAEFLSDKPQKTYDPFLLPDMEAGVDLILSEIKKKSKICIYGDYDADGITSSALMMGVLSYITDEENLDYYIPSRFEEGYGLNIEAIDHIDSSGCNLIITVDCGSVSFKEVEYAKKLGMKIVVTDHHNISDVMADCILINPKRPDSLYPFKDLSGCGVVFKVAQAIQKKAGLPKYILTEALDLAAIGTIGDIMPLLDENRTITKFGIKVLNLGKRAGLKQLIDGTSLKMGKITSGNISFVIVPHLNASGRIEDASQAVELLFGKCSSNRMGEIVRDVLEKNIKRRRLQAELFEQCCCEIDRDYPDDFVIIEAEAIYEGIAGIVAGKIKETFYRPAVIVTPTSEDEIKGTGRSIEGINLYQILKPNEDLFKKFGGHSGACGFSMKKSNLPELRNRIAQQMNELKAKDSEIFKKKFDIDLEAEVGELNMELAEQLEMMAPFGNKNPKPLIRCCKVTAGDVRYMGDEMQHVRFFAVGENGQRLQCVMFNKAQDYDFEEMKFTPVNILGTLECQEWQGKKRLQFLVSEIQFDEKQWQ